MAAGTGMMRPRRRQEYKADLLARALPEGMAAEPWREDVYLVHAADPQRGISRTRVMMRDGGWVEIDDREGTVRNWGTEGRAGDLAEAVADAVGYRRRQLERQGSARGASGSGPAMPLSESDAHRLAEQWRTRGYEDVVVAPGSVWITLDKDTRLEDTGNLLWVHGAVSDDAIRAAVGKAQGEWGGALMLHGTWSAADRDRVWLECQRQGVRLADVEPSEEARRSWDDERSHADEQTALRAAVSGSAVEARTLLQASEGDLEALGRLEPDLRAFVASYLDDEQRGELARLDAADVAAELRRFRRLGQEERRRAEAEGRKIDTPRPGTPTPGPGPLDMLTPG